MHTPPIVDRRGLGGLWFFTILLLVQRCLELFRKTWRNGALVTHVCQESGHGSSCLGGQNGTLVADGRESCSGISCPGGAFLTIAHDRLRRGRGLNSTRTGWLRFLLLLCQIMLPCRLVTLTGNQTGRRRPKIGGEGRSGAGQPQPKVRGERRRHWRTTLGVRRLALRRPDHCSCPPRLLLLNDTSDVRALGSQEHYLFQGGIIAVWWHQGIVGQEGNTPGRISHAAKRISGCSQSIQRLLLLQLELVQLWLIRRRIVVEQGFFVV
mmetsp:Transcript_40286/g.85809  ORF Transcript_40286/g.85809 Transcript_40286/m.85809 type:complete len:266 (-) Transcript_40286:1516-2313(-)